MIRAPGGVISGAVGDSDDGSIGIPADSADFGLEAVSLGFTLGEGQREGLDERIRIRFFLPIRQPMIEGADGRIVSQQPTHLRLVFAQEFEQTWSMLDMSISC